MLDVRALRSLRERFGERRTLAGFLFRSGIFASRLPSFERSGSPLVPASCLPSFERSGSAFARKSPTRRACSFRTLALSHDQPFSGNRCKTCSMRTACLRSASFFSRFASLISS